MKYRITYYAPYQSANFTCEADTLEDARKQRGASHLRDGYSVANREIKTESFGGTPV